MSDPFEAHHIRIIEWSRAQYQRTRNPFFVWQAYRQCRYGQIALPKWVLQYLDGAANKILAVNLKLSDLTIHAKDVYIDAKALPVVVSKAFGFSTATLNTWDRYKKHRSIAELINHKIKNGMTQRQACLAVKKEKNLSFSTAHRIYSTFRDEFVFQNHPRMLK